MPRPWREIGLIAIALLVTNTGCLFSGSKHRVLRQDETVKQVTFESEFAQQIFQRRALDEADRKSLSSSTSVGVPFLLGFSHSTEISPNAYYNDLILRCDVDGDGVISDHEASVLVTQNDILVTPSKIEILPGREHGEGGHTRLDDDESQDQPEELPDPDK